MGRYGARGVFGTLALASTVFIAVVLAGTFGMAPLGSVTVSPGTVVGASPNFRLRVDVPDGAAEGRGEDEAEPAPNGGEGSMSGGDDNTSASPTTPGAGAPPFGPQPPAPDADPGAGPGTGPGGPGGQPPPDDPGSLPGPPRPQPPGQEPPGPGPEQPGPQPPPYSPEIPRPSTGVPLPSGPEAPVVEPETPQESDGKKKPGKSKIGRPGKGAKPGKPGKTVGKPAKPPKVVVKPVTPPKSGKPHKAGSAPKGKGPVIIVTPPKPAQDKDIGPKYRPPEPAQQTHPTDPDKWQDAQPHPAHRDKAPKPVKARVAQTTAAVEPPSAPRPAPGDRPTTGNGNGKGKSKGGVPQAASAPPAAGVDTGRPAGGAKTKSPRGK